MPDPAPTTEKKETSAKNIRPAKAELNPRQVEIKPMQVVDKKEPVKSRINTSQPKLAPIQAANKKVKHKEAVQQKSVARIIRPLPVNVVALPVSKSAILSTLTEAGNNASSEDVQEKVLSPEPAHPKTRLVERPPERTDALVAPVVAEKCADLGQAGFFSTEDEVVPGFVAADLLELAELDLNIDRQAEMGLASADPAAEAAPIFSIAWDELIDEGHEPVVVLMQDLPAKLEIIPPATQEIAQQKFEDIVDMAQEIIDSEDQIALKEAVIELFELIDMKCSEEQLRDFVAVLLEPDQSDFVKQFARLISKSSQEQGTREIIPSSVFANLSLSSKIARLATRWQLGKLTLAQAVNAS